MVRDGAVDREALVGTKRERHEEPRRERIVGEGQSNRKAGRGKWWNDRWEGVGALREGTKRNGRSTICREIVPAPFHSPNGLHFWSGHRWVLTWALVSHRARGKWVGYMWLLGRIFYGVSSFTT